MSEPRPRRPDDLLHRYLLRRDLLQKVRDRAAALVRHGRREPLADIAGLVPRPEIVIDLGAHHGYVTHEMRRRWPSARILAIEAAPSSARTLRRSVAGLAGVEVVECAVADEEGVIEMLVDDSTHAGASNSLHPHSDEFKLHVSGRRYQRVEVECTTLDALCRSREIDHVEVLKVDVEGAEARVFAGAGGLLDVGAIDVILSEVRLVPGFEGAPLAHDVMAQMAGFGYTTYGIYRFAESEIGQGLFGDAVFLSPQFRARLVAERGARACGFLD